ncbi:MAG: MurT ligase domain-containing protein [Candidatus Nomurabacteria bacterium]|jgi:UDP-N-acetylmuramyl tripeptide synthase|nr:MurT ligase domain-containing protein [Candidatus Nomurabacteria bacterium]
MPKQTSIVIGKFVRKVARLRGGGSALPGLVIEKIDRSFVRDCLSSLPRGVVVISGTNGKTTTTKIVVELLESQGLKVFTNRTGSNFMRGVIAALLESINLRGQLNADIAVLELDEAHAVKFVDTVPPAYCLLLNVMRDQLDRFGEIDHTAQMLASIAAKTTKSVVINREDRRLAGITSGVPITYYGLSSELVDDFPEDDELLNKTVHKQPSKLPADVVLSRVTGNVAEFIIDGKAISAPLTLKGSYNIFNSAAALALVRQILPEAPAKSWIDSLANIQSAFGRGESFVIDGQPLELFLVKNPSGFQLALNSFSSGKHDTLIAINDNYADGRDMSWLWNVDFSGLESVQVISGIRAHDMTLRLKYDEVPVSQVEENLSTALDILLQSKVPKRIFATYTAMLEIRKHLAKYTNVERVL